ncbi:Lrp/AsnC ligand binding domain-containing protein [Natronoarchaeum sp. GCM10025703]|uniref:Lrp/AsnC ligand binding domain-containing protein n=1 Tax=unclassified Natronoarchaeum TaxID=2620183 RepID=UPI00360D314B
MVHAFVMVKTAAGKSESLLADVREENHVVEAHIVAGEYDIIGEVAVDEVYQVLEAASSGIQALPGVKDTKTYISLE